jgi:ankyrin repeat protein
VRADDEQMVRLLLRGGASAIAANRYGVTPLALAANNGNAGVIRALLEAGADANTTLAEGETVLMRAARSGSVPAIQALLEHGAQVNAAEGWLGETALMWAASENHASAVRLLVEKGAQIDARSKLIEFPDLKYPSTGLVRMVLPRGGWTPLMYAARQGSLEAVRTLSNLKADLNVKDPDGLTALVIAILNAHYEVAAALVENGADPNLADVSGRAALYALADMHTLAPMFSRPAPVPTGQLDALGLAKVLLARGARPNQVLTRALLPRHHNPGDRTMGEGSTPFMRAAQGGDVALMRLLLDSGADAALTQKNGTTALMLAAGGPGDSLQEEDAIAALELCLEKGLDINAVNTAGETAVHRAVDSGANDVVRFLAARGARLDVKNKRGSTPLDVALADGRDGDRTATIALLKELLAAGK